MITPPANAEHRHDLEGLAAITITAVEMGHTDEEVTASLANMAAGLGRLTRNDLILVAEAIRQWPQPPDEPAEERERRRPIEDMLGVMPVEDQLAAQLRARELALALADRLE